MFAACEAWGVSKALCFHRVFAVFGAWGVSKTLCFHSFYCLRGLGRFKSYVLSYVFAAFEASGLDGNEHFASTKSSIFKNSQGSALQMARGPPGIAPGIARHCSGQVVLANWLYDMMCVCCLCLSLFLSLTVFPLWCVLKRFQKKTSGDLTR